jgi:hypothetical protein
MSRKERQRRESRAEQIEREKLAIITRRKERMKPVYAYIRLLSLTLIGTAVLLVIGVIINDHMVDILNKLK